MEIVRSLNRSWIYETHFSLCRAIRPGEKVRGESPGINARMPVLCKCSITITVTISYDY